MHTEFILLSFLSFFCGVIFGKFLRKFNPFMMVLGVLLFAGVIQWLLIEENWFYQLIFIGGTLTNFKPFFYWIRKITKRVQSGVHSSWCRFFARRLSRKNTQKKAANEAHKERHARMQAEQEIADLKARLQDLMEKLKRSKQMPPAMPTTFNEACELFGLPSHVTLAEFKAARLKLLQQYHEDKCRHLGKKLQQQAKIETQRINTAWEIVKKRFKK